jgi:hypothetical protein
MLLRPAGESTASVVAGTAGLLVVPPPRLDPAPSAAVPPERPGARPVSGASANVRPAAEPAEADPSHPAAESPSTAAALPHTLTGVVTGALN